MGVPTISMTADPKSLCLIRVGRRVRWGISANSLDLQVQIYFSKRTARFLSNQI
ncbi:hypothetical protein LEP1GSC035_1609 [Leptospira noguchii str. 2007001578]|uniref:Uncharacterized protein n=1 Tax=Leptospira noguchii str. 2007001578 TaxID=1049974 RepID=A0ABP2TDR5_9LEPT|nr:hypothetical protein LEP1GSC035_1609 [Leptospira noguchii str. 2007001578]